MPPAESEIELTLDIKQPEFKIEYVTVVTPSNVLIIPSRTSDPASPVIGQTWLRTDL